MNLDWIRAGRFILLAAVVVTAAGCEETFPTLSLDDDLPIEAVTVEIRLPYSEFGSDFDVIGTYGLQSSLPLLTVAHEFGDSLEANALFRTGEFPASITAPDTLGTNRTDSLYTVPTGRLVVRLDTLAARPDSTFSLVAELLDMEWDRATANWEFAVDTVLRTEAWTEPGAGPGVLLGEGAWDAELEASDSLVIPLDSAGVAALQDSTGMARGLRIRMADSGRRVRLTGLDFRGDARPSFNADTTVTVTASTLASSFIHAPELIPAEGDLTVGGAPAWRSVFKVTLPDELEGNEEVCAEVTCPVKLTPERVVFAGLQLTGKTQDEAYIPVDTLLVDMRSIVNPGILPRSPLTSTIIPFPASVPPELFFPEADPELVEIPVTFYIRDLIRGETAGGEEVFPGIAILVPLEPLSFGAMRFYGPDSDHPPTIRLLLTLSDEVDLN